MRVLVLTNMYPSPRSPAAGIFVQREVEAIKSLCPDYTFEVLHVDTIASKWRYLTAIPHVAATVARFRPDVVHVHYGLSLIMASVIDKPLVCTFHGSDLNIRWQRKVASVLSSRIDRAIVVSASLSERVPRHVSTTVIPCGVDIGSLPSLGRSEARQLLGVGEAEVLLGFPGSPVKEIKRYDRFDAVTGRIPGARQIVFSGLAHAEALVWLAALDCLVMTSDAEGSPVITKEALCMGCRVVSTPVGDMRDQLTAMTGCRIAEDFSPEAISLAVQEALKETAPLRSVSRERFDVRQEARAVVALYQDVSA